jgi:hypothetical protein
VRESVTYWDRAENESVLLAKDNKSITFTRTSKDDRKIWAEGPPYSTPIFAEISFYSGENIP